MAFIDSSRQVADKFLQSVVFVDERAYIENDATPHSFNAQAVTKAFARKQKLCSVFAPTSEEEVMQSLPMLTKADVVVLDWNLDFSHAEGVAPEAFDDEEDAEQDDSRGEHTLALIKNIVEYAAEDRVRIVVIYTGETDLKKITREVHDVLREKGFEAQNCCVCSPNVRILVRAKSTQGKDQYQYMPELQEMVCDYNSLPDLVLNEFTQVVNGLLPIYALGAITAIRESTSRILGVFSKELDAAYLGHVVSIPDKEDGLGLLAEIFGTSIKELLEDSHLLNDDEVEEWIDAHIPDEGRPITIKNEVTVTKDKALKFWKSEKATLKEKLSDAFGQTEKLESIAPEKATLVFADNAQERIRRFAKLTQIRNSFGPSDTPKKLNQGTLVSLGEDYYLCIQPRCDTGRIVSKKEGEQAARPFLFLGLTETGKGLAVVVDDKVMHVDLQSYKVVTFTFSPIERECDIMFRKEGDQLQVTDNQGNRFVWKGELKELQAQRVNMSYANELSRVGLDESEWLRLQSK